MAIQLSQNHLLKTILSPLNNFGIIVKKPMSIDSQVYFWTLESILLVCMSVFVPVPQCPDYHCFVLSFEFMKSFYFVLYQTVLGILGRLQFPMNFRINLSIFVKNSHGTLIRTVPNVYISLRSISLLIMSILLIDEPLFSFFIFSDL